jgi:hypothetical protein
MGVWIHQWKACERSNLTSFASFSDAVHWVDAEIVSRFFKKKTLGNVFVKIFKNKTLANVSVKIFKKKNNWEYSFRQDLQEENLLGMFLLSRSPRRKTLTKCFLSPSQFFLGNVLCVSFAVCFVEECREIAHDGQVQRNQRHGKTHTHTQNSNPNVVHAAKRAEMFADFPIIVKLHQKIVVSYMSLEAIATGFFF